MSESSNAKHDDIERRVRRTFARQNLGVKVIVHLGKGVIRLDLSKLDPNERAIAIARTVAGVTSVTT